MKSAAEPACRSRETRMPLWLRRPVSQLAASAILVTMVTSSGCVRRRMTVRTSPSGATISVDNQVIGTSPAATSFVYYGTREIRVEKDGYRTETIRRRLNPPWYEYPGLDFISETLWPGELRDERIIDIQLIPKTLTPTPEVLDRADALRTQSQAGIVTGSR
ncbi:PEGA domain protein [Novipirellula aureliae]|uniref:PEGA domain protein n=1 Tax=Novipirellula aureliae TaxID=2527966 RepID=A0A5C6DNB1_9BACT|nr:PEGA domain-containing protein [Novipirellula aureliae]TWU38763.1 PEGA domain protein [Novipirellula aureliae]